MNVSVVMPVHNCERFIAETARSVLAQLAVGDQCIVVDDGSTDGTRDVLRQFGDAIELLEQQNLGEIAAVNRGIAATRNAIVAVINADDPILPGLVDAARQAFAANSKLAGVYPDWHHIDENGRVLAEITTREFSLEALVCEHHCLPGPGAFFRPALLAREPVRDPRAFGVSDHDFWLRLSLRGPLQRIPRTLATWRSHPSSATFTLPGAELAQAKISMIERFFARADLPLEVQPWRRRALSAAYYNAALVGLRRPGVPAIRYGICSYALALVWASSVPRSQRRSFPHLLYASLQPLSGSLHACCDALLAPQHRHRAVMTQRFGIGYAELSEPHERRARAGTRLI